MIEKGDKVFAVVYGNYEPLEVDSLWSSLGDAQAEALRKNLENGAWNVVEMEIR